MRTTAAVPAPKDWGDPTSVIQPRQPAFWLLVGLTALGAIKIGSTVGEAFRLYPAGSLLAVTLLTLYSIPFFVFVYRLDLFEREPVTMVAAAFSWGGLVATSLALSGNQAIFGLASKLASPDFAGRWGPALAAPPVEETLKVLGVIVLVLIARDQFDSPLDGMVYGALVGLGFQVVENFIYCINGIALGGGDSEIAPVLVIFVIRALVGLWSHATYTAIAGLRHRLLRHPAGPQRRLPAGRGRPQLRGGVHRALRVELPPPHRGVRRGRRDPPGPAGEGHPRAVPAHHHVPAGPQPGGDVVPRRRRR